LSRNRLLFFAHLQSYSRILKKKESAGVGLELTRSLGAEVAFIYVVDSSVDAYAPEGGIPASQRVMVLATIAGFRRWTAR